MGSVVGVTLAVGLGLLLLNNRLGEKLLHLSYDLPFRFRPTEQPSEVVIVYLDDSSHRALNQPYSKPWDRGLYARLLNRLTAEKAKAVTFDILFSEPNTEHPGGDEEFARAIRANGKVVLGAEYTTAPGGGWTFVRGLDAFSEGAAAWGMVQLFPDQDFVVRKHLHVPFNKDDDLYSSLTWQLAKVAGVPFAKDPEERYRERWLNYYGPPLTIPSISFEQAIETNGYCPANFLLTRSCSSVQVSRPSAPRSERMNCARLLHELFFAPPWMFRQPKF
jgi:CHASE2 domain-containing sensor protein